MSHSRFTVERQSAPLNYRGINHARSTESVEQLSYTPLTMILRLLRLVGAGNTITIHGGVRGVAWYFDWPGPNGSLKKHLAELSSQGHIEYRWADTDLIITVLVPDEIGERSAQIAAAPQPTPPAPQPEAPPAPAPRSGQITMNHDLSTRGVEGDAPTALLSPAQTLLFNALLSEGVRDRTHALEAAKAAPQDATISDFREQVAHAAERGKYNPLGYVIALWRVGQMFRRPLRKEATPAQKGTRHEPRRSAPARSAKERNVPPAVSPPPGLKLARVSRPAPPPGADGG